MRLCFLLALAVVTIGLRSANSEQWGKEYAVYGIGSLPCSEFLSSTDLSAIRRVDFLSWFLGYLSALNREHPNIRDRLGHAAMDDFPNMLVAECLKTSEQTFAEAAESVDSMLMTHSATELLRRGFKPLLEQ